MISHERDSETFNQIGCTEAVAWCLTKNKTTNRITVKETERIVFDKRLEACNDLEGVFRK